MPLGTFWTATLQMMYNFSNCLHNLVHFYLKIDSTYYGGIFSAEQNIEFLKLCRNVPPKLFFLLTGSLV